MFDFYENSPFGKGISRLFFSAEVSLYQRFGNEKCCFQRMAIIGVNTELPLPDLLTTLRNQYGRLTFSDLGPVSSIEIYLAPSIICGFIVCGVCVTDEAVILEKLVAITASQRGRFHFEPLPGEMINQRVRLSIDGVNLAVVTMADEIAWRQSDFVLPSKMVILNETGCQFDDAMVASFFGRSLELLEIGVDAQQLANQMHISLMQAQFYVLKFLEAGAVKIGMPKSGYEGRPSPIIVQSSRFGVVRTQRMRTPRAPNPSTRVIRIPKE